MQSLCKRCGSRGEGKPYNFHYGTVKEIEYLYRPTKYTYRIHGREGAFICDSCASRYHRRRRIEPWIGGPGAFGLFVAFVVLWNRYHSDYSVIVLVGAIALGLVTTLRGVVYSYDRDGGLENLAWGLCRKEILARFGTNVWRNAWRTTPVKFWNSSNFSSLRASRSGG